MHITRPLYFVSPVRYRSCSQSVGVVSLQRRLFLFLKNYFLEFLFNCRTGHCTCKSITQTTIKNSNGFIIRRGERGDSAVEAKQPCGEFLQIHVGRAWCRVCMHCLWCMGRSLVSLTPCLLIFLCVCTWRWQEVLRVIKSILTQWLCVARPKAIIDSTVSASLIRLYLAPCLKANSFENRKTLFNKDNTDLMQRLYTLATISKTGLLLRLLSCEYIYLWIANYECTFVITCGSEGEWIDSLCWLLSLCFSCCNSCCFSWCSCSCLLCSILN